MSSRQTHLAGATERSAVVGLRSISHVGKRHQREYRSSEHRVHGLDAEWRMLWIIERILIRMACHPLIFANVVAQIDIIYSSINTEVWAGSPKI